MDFYEGPPAEAMLAVEKDRAESPLVDVYLKWFRYLLPNTPLSEGRG